MTHPQTWPGTAIIKTRHNAFDWRGQPSQIVAKHPNEFKHGTHSANGVKELATTEPRLSPAQKAAADVLRKRHGGAYSQSKSREPSNAA